jgi:hypothetical protein
MTLDEIDKSELILESYRIEGIQASECRSIFLDWVLKLPAEFDQKAAIEFLVASYGEPAPDHPMSAVLQGALQGPATAQRRGGRAARVRH